MYVVLGDVGSAVVVVGAAGETELVWVDAEVAWVFGTFHGPAHEILLGLTCARRTCPRCRRSRSSRTRQSARTFGDFRIGLDLHHFDQPLEWMRGARIRQSMACRSCRRLRTSGPCCRSDYAVSRAACEPFFSCSAIHAQSFSSSRCRARERHVRDVQVSEEDVAVHVPGVAARPSTRSRPAS